MTQHAMVTPMEKLSTVSEKVSLQYTPETTHTTTHSGPWSLGSSGHWTGSAGLGMSEEISRETSIYPGHVNLAYCDHDCVSEASDAVGDEGDVNRSVKSVFLPNSGLLKVSSQFNSTKPYLQTSASERDGKPNMRVSLKRLTESEQNSDVGLRKEMESTSLNSVTPEMSMDLERKKKVKTFGQNPIKAFRSILNIDQKVEKTDKKSSRIVDRSCSLPNLPPQKSTTKTTSICKSLSSPSNTLEVAENKVRKRESKKSFKNKPKKGETRQKNIFALRENVKNDFFNDIKDNFAGDKEERCPSILVPVSDNENDNFHALPVTLKRNTRGEQINAKFLRHMTENPAAESHVTNHFKDVADISAFEGGEVLVTDLLSNKIVLYDTGGDSVVTFSVSCGSEPWSSTLTPAHAMAVALRGQGCVATWSPAGQPIMEFGGINLQAPTGLRCDKSGRFILTDESRNQVFIFSQEGQLLTELTIPGAMLSPGVPPCPAVQPSFSRPRYVCVSPDGNYVICDSANHCVRLFDDSGKYISTFGGYGRRDGQMKFPYGVACDQSGNIYVADHYNNRVSLFSPHGAFLEHLLTSDIDGLLRPKALAVTDSLLYVSHGEFRADKISVYSLTKNHESSILSSEVNA